jgi:hypothetical protein
MRRGFGRLPFFGHGSTRAEPSPSDEAAAVLAPIDLDLAPLGPPMLVPRAIFRQVLFDATELVPSWAMPRAEPGPVTPPTEPKATKRPSRPKATKTSAAKPVQATPPNEPQVTKHPSRPKATKTSAAKPATATPRGRTRKASDLSTPRS